MKGVNKKFMSEKWLGKQQSKYDSFLGLPGTKKISVVGLLTSVGCDLASEPGDAMRS